MTKLQKISIPHSGLASECAPAQTRAVTQGMYSVRRITRRRIQMITAMPKVSTIGEKTHRARKRRGRASAGNSGQLVWVTQFKTKPTA